jgi:transposase-like protein
MVKYTEEIKAQCVELVKSGKNLTEVSKELGPNPKAISRYCEKAGYVIPKKEKVPKADKA